MTVLAPAAPSFRTVAELLEQLGDVPPERVLLRPPPGDGTERDVIRLRDHDKRLCELVDGVLVEKAMGQYESRVAVVLIYFLETFLDTHDLGVVYGEAGTIRLTPGLVRIPDVTFVGWDRLPGRELPAEPIPDLIPHLAVEVLSASNTAREMTRKIDEYFRAGVQLVWLIDPPTRTAEVYTAPTQRIVVAEDQALDGGAVLSGFALPLRRLFDRAGRQRGR